MSSDDLNKAYLSQAAAQVSPYSGGMTAVGNQQLTIPLGGQPYNGYPVKLQGLYNGFPSDGTRGFGARPGDPGLFTGVMTNAFVHISESLYLHSNGRSTDLGSELRKSKKIKYLSSNGEICMPKGTWDLICLYLKDEGYGDMELFEFIDRSLSREAP